MRIRYLPETLINQIAAGEVIERPAAAVKELVENAIDAGSTRIEITLREGGKSLLSVVDNGSGMDREELAACVDRHATSKLPSDDLFDIRHLGFRGEALASIAAVARLKIETCAAGGDGWTISVEGGKKSEIAPSSWPQGTKIEVRDLFYATPARLKFLKSERAEYMAVKEVITNLAMAFPHIAFKLTHNETSGLNLPAHGNVKERLSALMGPAFSEDSFEVEAEREGVRLHGRAGLPTFHKATAQYQYLFVNGRPVKDKLLRGCVRGAYADVLTRDRHAALALFLEIPPEDVDVNVHPAKAEVRFKDPAMVRGLIVSALKHSLHGHGFQSARSVSYRALGALGKSIDPSPAANSYTPLPLGRGGPAVPASYAYGNLAEAPQGMFEAAQMPSARAEPLPAVQPEQIAYPLGAARGT